MSTDNSKLGVDVELGSDVLALIDALYKKGDTHSLNILHTILTKLIMSNIQDSKTSFIDLVEYCESLVQALGGSEAAVHESNKLRGLIISDLSLPTSTNSAH